METPKPIIVGSLDNIDKAMKIVDWADDILVEFTADTAAKLDHLQQGLTLAGGTILKRVGDKIKKEQQRIGRIINKTQKALDYNQLAIGSTVTADTSQVESVIDSAPVADIIPESGTPVVNVPSTPSLSGSGGTDGTTPPNNCTPGDQYIDPTDCSIYQCDGTGKWIKVGVDPNCMKDKGNNGTGDGNNGNGNGVNTNQNQCSILGTWANEYYALTYEWESQWYNQMGKSIQFSPDIVTQMKFDRRRYTLSTLDFNAKLEAMPSPGEQDCFEQVNTVVSIPYQRNSPDRISIYTDEGQNMIRERFNTVANIPSLRSVSYEAWIANISDAPKNSITPASIVSLDSVTPPSSFA